MHTTFGLLQVTLKYTYTRSNGAIIYQRAVPAKLRVRYPGPTVKHDLKTKDIAVAAKSVTKLNQRYETEWAGLITAPESSSQALKIHAVALLTAYGLAPGAANVESDAADLFFDKLEDKRQRHAGDNRDTYDNADLADYLAPVEHEALKLLQGRQLPTLSDALELHLSAHQKKDDVAFTVYQRRAFASLLAVTGDKPVNALTRDDVRRYIAQSHKRGAATATTRRLMGAMRAVFTTWRLERDKAFANPFEKMAIPNEGVDKKSRVPFNTPDLIKLYALCRTQDDDRRWLLALLIDTGARLAEITGLALADIALNADVPHIHIRVHPWRSLKNLESIRMVPLVGASLWAAQRVVVNALPDQRFAFPRYANDSECKATAASATLVSWIRRTGIDHVVHELRHTMADRLRNVGCSKEIRYAIDGHASQDVGDTYGRGHGLDIMAQWLTKVALVR